MAWDSSRGTLILFGGGNDENIDYDNTWAWDGTNWNLLSPLQSPPSRSHHVMVSVAGRPLLFGGVRNLFEYLDDTWAFAG